MRVLLLGAFDPDYARHAILHAGLEAAGVDVVVRRLPKQAGTAARARLLARAALHGFDALIIPAFNQTLGPLAWARTRGRRRPAVLLDYMVGLADVNADRATVSGARAGLFRLIDRFNLRMLDSMTDTAAHRDHFARTLNLDTRRVRVVPVGVVEHWLDVPPPPLTPPYTVTFIGTYIPFQGVEVILQAAARLRGDSRLRFRLIGNGQTYPAMARLAETLRLDNVRFDAGFYPFCDLQTLLSESTFILGVFGAAEKTAYVVPNKVFDGLAMGRPVITADSPALREYFTPGEHLVAVPPGDAEALAEALAALAGDADRIAALGAAARARIQAAFLPRHIGEEVRRIIRMARETPAFRHGEG
jgi:glycosyltransferase involved in cell wall biosynthesis